MLSFASQDLSLPEGIQVSMDGIDVRDNARKGRCVCINPGYAARGTSGGTFAEIIFSSRDSNIEPLHKRLQVKVLRI